MIHNYSEEDKDGIIQLWNEAGVRLGYKEMNSERFSKIFTENTYFNSEYTFVMQEGDKITGFACSCIGDDLPLGNTSGYLTCILLAKEHETSDNYRRFMDYIEAVFVKAGKIQSEILFFNPMMLPWYIKGTDHHEHNNAPGVFKTSRLYTELFEYGYKERATECAMYLKLEHFTIPEKVLEKEEKVALEGYEVSLFDKNRHQELDIMLKKLENPLWEKEILKSAEDGNPVLIASWNGKAVGFAGPISRQESGRGYFTGIGVNKEHEGHGLGTILFYKLCQEEEKVGAQYMSLYTGATNPAAKIYLQAGFTIVEEFAIMRKILVEEGK